MKITHEDRLVWGDVARVFPPPREMFERVRCLLGALEETEAELAKERERSKKIAVEAASYATEIEDLKARIGMNRKGITVQEDALNELRCRLAAEREEVVRLDKELGRERANADAALASMNEQALAQHKRIVELEAALNGTLHAESDEHDASMRQWGERHPAGAGAIALGPRKSKPPCKTPFQPKDIVIEAEVAPKGERRSGYVAVAVEPQEAK